MSTNILDKSCDTLSDGYISLFVVTAGRAELEDLADFVRRTRHEKNLSLRAVEENSGGAISKGYVGQIENRAVLGHSVTPQKLSALSKGLQVSEDEIFAVARGKVSPVRSVVITSQDVETRTRRRELMGLLFDDLPDDCQLDTLASMIGVHARRGLSLRIHERSGARSEAISKISQLVRDLLPATAVLLEGEGAAGEDAEQRNPNVKDAPANLPLPKTTPQFTEDAEEDEGWGEDRNGTNGSDS